MNEKKEYNPGKVAGIHLVLLLIAMIATAVYGWFVALVGIGAYIFVVMVVAVLYLAWQTGVWIRKYRAERVSDV